MDGSFVLTSSVVRVHVSSLVDLVCNKPDTKEKAIQIITTLVQTNKKIDFCNKYNPPKSMQAKEVIFTVSMLGANKSLPKKTPIQKEALNRWEKVFSNPISLSLSFREHYETFTPEFLRDSPDLDYGALGTLVCICGQCDAFKKMLNNSLVISKNQS